MKNFLLPENGNFYKANMHCHSTWSDGACTPEELKAFYKDKGYSVLAITDHEGLFYHDELNDDDFLTIAGCELEFNEPHGADYNNWITAHLCVYKKDISEVYQMGYDPNYTHPTFRFLKNPEKMKLLRSRGEVLEKTYSPENINKVIKTYRDNGFLVTWNHPKWSQEDYENYIRYENMNCMEVFNSASHYRAGLNEHNGDVYDQLLKKGKRLFCVAADDNHVRPETENSGLFGGFIMLKASALTYANIIDAFEKGNFYSSTGPKLAALYTEDGCLCVQTETPAKRIRFLTGCRYAKCFARDDGAPIFAGRFPLRGDYRYCRVEVEGMDGSMAYTNAYFPDQLQ